MNKRPLRIHQVELMVNAREHLSHTCRVRYHTHRSLHLRKITTRNHRWRLIINPTFESSRAPVDKLNRPLCFNSCHCCIHIFWDHITPIHQTTSHVFTMTRVTFRHHRRRFKSRVCDLSN
ncbi:hypothetical protein HanIR_Chr12g0595531 [Helianthus annuus]|nr:hypothetical protein HanIR_Chr12g0595531 [Helianthus annuus]